MKSVLALLISTTTTTAFVLPQQQQLQTRQPQQYATILNAKKKTSAGAGKGFGKAPEPAQPKASSAAAGEPSSDSSSSSPFLQSVAEGGSDTVPVIVDESLSPEERAEKVLREKYGMKTLEEQQLDAKKREQLKEQRQKMQEWKKMAEEGKDFDCMGMIPGPVQIAIDRFLKAGVAICTVLFVLAGFAIALEAWSKASGDALPANVDEFIVQTIEPNFTPGLFVLLGFSVSLGAFAALQLGSEGAQYRED